jgi:hypothetical protein
VHGARCQRYGVGHSGDAAWRGTMQLGAARLRRGHQQSRQTRVQRRPLLAPAPRPRPLGSHRASQSLRRPTGALPPPPSAAQPPPARRAAAARAAAACGGCERASHAAAAPAGHRRAKAGRARLPCCCWRATASCVAASSTTNHELRVARAMAEASTRVSARLRLPGVKRNGRGHRRAKRRPPRLPPLCLMRYATTSPAELPDYLPYGRPFSATVAYSSPRPSASRSLFFKHPVA